MLKKGSTESINVRIWVFDLTDGTENARDSLEASSGEVANVVVLDVLVSKLFQMHESGVSVSEDSVSISRDNSTFT